MFRARIRFRVAKRFGTEQTVVKFPWKDRELELKSQTDDEPLNKTDWLVLVARGFDSADDALAFGIVLNDCLLVAGLACLLGVDVGNDKSTSWVNEKFLRDSKLLADDERLLQNVHGLLVFPDDGKSRLFILNANLSVNASADGFITALTECSRNASFRDRHFFNALRVMNFSFMTNDALAKMVLAFSAVEEIGQSEKWHPRQLEIMRKLADAALQEFDCEQHLLAEVRDAILRNTYRITLRQGVLRLLEKYELGKHKREWDKLYTFRSGVFHGTIAPDRAEIENHAFETQKLCARIVARVAENHGIVFPKILATNLGQEGSLVSDAG